MELLKVGLVGSGGMAEARAAALKRSGRAQIVGVASANVDRAKAFTIRFGGEVHASWEALASDPAVDAVMVCTPNDLHVPICKASLEAGKHVLCEYALARSRLEAREIVDAWEGSGRVLHVGHTMRYSGKQQVLKTLVSQLGPLRLADVEILFGRKPRKWYPDPQKLGSVFVGAMIHFQDELRQLFGEVERVAAHMQRAETDEGLTDWDVASMWMAFVGGGLGRITYGRGLAPPGWEMRERYVFADAYVEVRGERALVQKNGETREHRIPPVDAIQADTDAFLAEALDGKEQVLSPYAALRAVAVGEAADVAARLGRWVAPVS